MIKTCHEFQRYIVFSNISLYYQLHKCCQSKNIDYLSANYIICQEILQFSYSIEKNRTCDS